MFLVLTKEALILTKDVDGHKKVSDSSVDHPAINQSGITTRINNSSVFLTQWQIPKNIDHEKWTEKK